MSLACTSLTGFITRRWFSVGTIAHVHDGGHARELLARWADLSHFDLQVAKLVFDGGFGFTGGQAPQM